MKQFFSKIWGFNRLSLRIKPKHRHEPVKHDVTKESIQLSYTPSREEAINPIAIKRFIMLQPGVAPSSKITLSVEVNAEGIAVLNVEVGVIGSCRSVLITNMMKWLEGVGKV
mgnify:CR=1 FL=1